MKKRTGNKNKKEYEIIDVDTAEIYIKNKEFNQMSRNPGIGKNWLEKYKTDVYTTGKVIIRGHPTTPPRYYDKRFAKTNPLAWEGIQWARLQEALAQKEHHTPERLAVQEQLENARTQTLKRKLSGV